MNQNTLRLPTLEELKELTPEALHKAKERIKRAQAWANVPDWVRKELKKTHKAYNRGKQVETKALRYLESFVRLQVSLRNACTRKVHKSMPKV